MAFGREVAVMLAEKAYEIMEGKKYYMSPTNLFHYNASDKLSDAIKKRLDKSKYKLTEDVCLIPEGYDMKLYPDVAVFASNFKYSSSGAITTNPIFVAEIISPSSRRKDTAVKPKIYEQIGVKEYWLVDPYGKCVTAYMYNESSHALEYTDTYQKLSAEDLETMPDEPQDMRLDFLDTEININEIFEE